MEFIPREITNEAFVSLFSVNPSSVGSCGDRNCCRRATVRLGIDTLIANTLVGIGLSVVGITAVGIVTAPAPPSDKSDQFSAEN